MTSQRRYIDRPPSDPHIQLIPGFVYKNEKLTLIVDQKDEESAKILGAATPEFSYDTNRHETTGFFVSQLRRGAIQAAKTYLRERFDYRQVCVESYQPSPA